MNRVMGEYINDFLLMYLDDILVFSSTEHEHENYETCFLVTKVT